MAQPFPPQGNQKQHTEKPLKVYAEQYLEGEPLPVGAVVEAPVPGGPWYTDGKPRVLLPAGWTVVELTDWVISSRYSGQQTDVLSDEEYTERFGSGGGPNAENPVP